MRRLACLVLLACTPAHAGGYPGYVQSQQAYAQPYRQQYVEKVYYQFLPILSPGEYYGGMVAGQLKQQKALAAEQQVQADLASRVDRLAAAVENLQKSIGSVPPGPLPTPQPPVTPAPPPVPTEPAEPAAGTPGAVMDVLSRRCLKCHTSPAKAGGGYILFDAPDVLAALGPLDLLAIDQQTYSGTMPPDKPIPREEYETLRAWINDHTDEITAAIKAAAATAPKGK